MKPILFDLHSDTATACFDQDKSLVCNDWQMDASRGTNALDGWIQTFAAFLSDDVRGEAAYEKFLGIRLKLLKEISQSDGKLSLFHDGDGPTEGVCKVLLSVEGGCVLNGKLERAEELKRLGVSFLTLTWNGDNEIGSGAGGSGGGLTAFGKELIPEMEKQNIIVDISHLCDNGVYDVFSLAKKPLIATHSNARAIWDCPRNLTDEQLSFLIKNKGICGLNGFPLFINGEQDYQPTDYRRHLEHILKLGGEDIIAIGMDWDGASMPSFIKDIEGLYSLYSSVVKWYGEKLAQKLFYENALSFVRENLSICADAAQVATVI